MRNQKGSLVFLHHEGIFETRDKALTYISENYKFASVYGEPFVVKYGDVDNQNLILGIGTKGKVGNAPGGGGYVIIDITKTNEDIAKTNVDIAEVNSKTETINAEITELNTKVDNEITRSTQKDEELDGRIDSLEDVVSGKVDKNGIELSGEGLKYTLYVDGDSKGEINIPKDRFLKKVNYEPTTHKLVFDFVTLGEEVDTVEIPIGDLVDTYGAGPGLKLNKNNNKFSVDIDNSSEGYLQISSEKKLGVYGLNDKFAETETSANAYADTKVAESKTELQGLITTVQTNVDNEAEARREAVEELDGRIVALDGRITDNEALIGIINGNLATEGSFRKEVATASADAKEYADGKVNTAVNTLSDTLNGRIDGINETVTANSNDINDIKNEINNVIEGNDAQEGSIRNAIKVSEDYTDSKVSDLQTQINSKANSDDVYTKTYIDNQGYITDVSNLATKERVREVSNSVTENTNKIAAIEQTIRGNLFDVGETDTIRLRREDGTPKTIYGEVKINDGSDNIIHKDGNGIYANVTLSYDKAENELTFSTGGVDQKFELNNNGILQDAMYDSENKNIVLIFKKDDETTKRVEIGVSGLVNTWEVENTENSPIILKKEEKENGDVLSATVSILNNDKNLLVNGNHGLFVDGDCNAHFALWRNEETTVQLALNNINDFLTLFDFRISRLEEKYTELQTKVEQAITTANIAKQTADEAKSKADALEQRIDDLEGNILEPGTYQP